MSSRHGGVPRAGYEHEKIFYPYPVAFVCEFVRWSFFCGLLLGVHDSLKR